MKKPALVLALVLLLLLAACGAKQDESQQTELLYGEAISELPEGAEPLFSYSAKGEYGTNINCGSFKVSGAGRFVLEIDVENGQVEDLLIRTDTYDIYPLLYVAQVARGGMYRTDSFTLPGEFTCVLELGRAGRLTATFTIYFVRE